MSLDVPVLRRLQEQYAAAIDREMERWLRRVGPHDQFSGMMRYQLGTVDEQLRPSGQGGGKRFRPLLCLLACETARGQWSDALPVAAGIELLHNFSLIHDDIEDRDPARRHRPTVWKLWGEPQAINAGDGMFAVATRAVAEIEDAAGLTLVRGFQDMALDLTRGQYLDMSFETRREVSSAEYLEMISLKSAAIVRFSGWAGAVVAGAAPQTAAALASFGDALGRAFQIADDILGIWGDPARTGKERATDIRNRKKTLPVLLALERATGATAHTLDAFYRHETDDTEPVLDALDALGVHQEAVEAMRLHQQEALAALGAAGSALSPNGVGAMKELVYELTGS